jgi:molybdenum cofactor biosynthesis enzyme MoaA
MNYYELEPEENHFTDVIVDVTHRCNMTCKNCYIPNRDVPDMDIEKMIDAISRFPKRTMIRIIGAEPTMRHDLDEIIRRIRQSKNRVTLLTNGLRLAKDSYVKHLKSAGLRHCYLSMNGADNDDWYEQIDELRCATKKVNALRNLVNNNFIIDTGTIVVRGINDDVISRMLHVYKDVGATNVMCRIKNIGDIGRSMNDSKNYSLSELITLLSEQTGLSEDYIYSWKERPIYENNHIEKGAFMVPMDESNVGKPIHKSGVWFKFADWSIDDNDLIPLPNSLRRGRLTQDFKVAPFFEHVKRNEYGY